MTATQLAACRARLECFLVEMLPPLGRKDRRHWAGVYLRGLLLDGDLKSAGAMAARLPDGNERLARLFLRLEQQRRSSKSALDAAPGAARAPARAGDLDGPLPLLRCRGLQPVRT